MINLIDKYTDWLFYIFFVIPFMFYYDLFGKIEPKNEFFQKLFSYESLVVSYGIFFIILTLIVSKLGII